MDNRSGPTIRTRRRLSAAAEVISVAAFLIMNANAQPSTNASTFTVTATEKDHPGFKTKIVGQGPPIILIPGLASSSATWDGTVAHLSTHYRCIELTLAGFAGIPPTPAPLLSSVRDQIAEYIRENQLERPVIIGHSLGGSIALDLASRYPQLVGPIVIADSLPFFAGVWYQSDSLAAAQPTIAKMRAGMEALTPAQWEAYTRSGASTNGMATSPDDQKTLIEWGLESDQKTVTETTIELVSTDLRPELPKIETPVLVIGTWVGLQNYGVTEASAEEVFRQQYAGVKHFEFVMSKQARHFVMWDDPLWFNTQVDRFLASSNPVAGGEATVAPNPGRNE